MYRIVKINAQEVSSFSDLGSMVKKIHTPGSNEVTWI